MSLERPQADYFAQVHNHSSWMDSHQNIHGRSGSVRSCSGGAINTFPGPISTALDPFAGDLSVSSAQLNYGPGYVSSHENSSHRDF